MFERLTSSARHALVLAQKQARAQGRDAIGPEHVLLGVVEEKLGLGAQVLIELGVPLESVADHLGEMTGSVGTRSSESLPFSPATRRLLENSLWEARRLDHDHIGTEHLLLAALLESEGPTAVALREWGVRQDAARSLVARSLAHEDDAPQIARSVADRHLRLPVPKRLQSIVRAPFAISRAAKLQEKGGLEEALATLQYAVEVGRFHSTSHLMARTALIEFFEETSRPLRASTVYRAVAEDAQHTKRYSFAGRSMLGRQVRVDALEAVADMYQEARYDEEELAARLEQADAERDAEDLDARRESLLRASELETKLGRLRDAANRLEGMVREAEGRSDFRTLGLALAPLARLRFHFGDLDGARTMIERAIELREYVGDPGYVAEAHWFSAFFSVRTGDLPAATESLRTAVQLMETVPDQTRRVAAYRRALEALPGPFLTQNGGVR